MIRGERFELNLDSDDEDNEQQQQQSANLPAAFVGDVLERKPAAPKPPSLPSMKNKTGFPEHKKRPAESRFKQQKKHSQVEQAPHVSVDVQSGSENVCGSHTSGKAKTWEEEEKERIDQENRQKIAQMSPEEIEEERRELMNSLGPEFLQRLLLRSNVESGSEETDLSKPMGMPSNINEAKAKARTEKTVTFEGSVKEDVDKREDLVEESEEPAEDSTTPPTDSLPHDTIHFPRPPQPPSLDPSSETFLTDLHEKYFPSLPSDPSKLEWMQSSSNTTSSYDPSSSAFDAGSIRFSFKGELLPPRLASEIPVTAGLHHHGDAPDAAGYTIAELAHLARSTYPAQRCIAFQTLGRVLYRLGQGEFGNAGEADAPETLDSEDSMRELARGLWHEVERLKVIQILVDESEGKGVDGGRHLSAKTYAIEAVWLWRKGGGRRWKAA